MKTIDTFPTYDIANDHQITLLAAGIDAKVEYVTGSGRGVLHIPTRYALMVYEEDAQKALEILNKPLPDYDGEPIEPAEGEPEELGEPFHSMLRCPKCGSEDVEGEAGLVDSGVLFAISLILVIPLILSAINRKRNGEVMRCKACGNKFRLKV